MLMLFFPLSIKGKNHAAPVFFNGDSVIAENASQLARIYTEAAQARDIDCKTVRHYRTMARRARRAARLHGHLQFVTRDKIARLIQQNPELYRKFQNLRTQDGALVRIMITSYFRSPDDILIGKTHTAYDQRTGYGIRLFSPRIAHKGLLLQERLDNVMHISLAVDAGIPTLRHELGHAAYAIRKSRAYYHYIKHYVAHQDRYDGHGHHDHGGKEAYHFETMEEAE
ncbi:MAG: hypothetical protein AAFV07_11595 [Bacteroidota bacterium]